MNILQKESAEDSHETMALSLFDELHKPQEYFFLNKLNPGNPNYLLILGLTHLVIFKSFSGFLANNKGCNKHFSSFYAQVRKS